MPASARRRASRALLTVPLGLAAAVAIYAGLTLPPRALTVTAPVPDTVVFGAYHVHSTRSDGSGTIDEIASAAARAGLTFVILTDHGDGTRVPDPPAYRDGVLMIDAVEISTLTGHVVALGLTGAAPYRLAGEARDAVEDIHRLGGRAIVAHPDSPRVGQRWRSSMAQVDGFEWINADSEWRDDSPQALVAAALHSVVRPAEAVASLFSRPAQSLQRWDEPSSNRPLVVLAAVDAHANLGVSDDTMAANDRPHRSWFHRPSYEVMFRTLQQGVVLDTPLSRDAARDGAAVTAALLAGRTFSIVRAIGGPATLEFSATQQGVETRMAGRIGDIDPVVFQATTTAPGARLVLLHDGRQVAESASPLRFTASTPAGQYRVEAFRPGVAVPWLLSNAIYTPMPAPAAEAAAANESGTLVSVDAQTAWRAEKDQSSAAAIAAGADRITLTYTLGGGTPAGQYVALVTDLSGQESFDRVVFSGHASRPMRVSVQLRFAGSRDRRWVRSVYLDQTSREVSLDLSAFEPVEPTSLRPRSARIQSVLLVVDTLNTTPGTTGELVIGSVKLRVGRSSN